MRGRQLEQWDTDAEELQQARRVWKVKQQLEKELGYLAQSRGN